MAEDRKHAGKINRGHLSVTTRLAALLALHWFLFLVFVGMGHPLARRLEHRGHFTMSLVLPLPRLVQRSFSILIPQVWVSTMSQQNLRIQFQNVLKNVQAVSVSS